MATHKAGETVWVYGHSEAVVLQPDDRGAIVREVDDSSETWFAWSDLPKLRNLLSQPTVFDLHSVQVSAWDILANAASLISENGENAEYDRGICELICDLTGLTPDDRDAVLAYLHSAQAFEAQKAKMDSLLYRRNVN